MSSDKNKNQQQLQQSNDRYYSQQGPMADAMAYNYGRGTESDYGNYTDIMNQYRNIATGQGGGGSGSGGGGYSTFDASGMYSPFTVSYSDPFKSYTGFEEFSNTGGYSPQDMANLRARGMSPIRAAYGNAEREIGRQRSLQGGYAPNAIAAQTRMAREQGQSMADAVQNIEGGIVQSRNQGKLAGLGGMSNIEGQRLDAQLKSGMFNAEAQERAQVRNIDAASDAASRSAANSAASAAASQADRFRALQGMTSLYGTTPGMSNMFGNQLISAVGQGGQYDINSAQARNQTATLPSMTDTVLNRTGQIANMAGPIVDYYTNRKKNQVGNVAPLENPGFD